MNTEKGSVEVSPPEVGALQWTPSSWVSSIWLVFLAFPLLAVWSNTEISVVERNVAVLAIVLFGMCCVIGERSHARQWWEWRASQSSSPLPDWLSPRRPVLWFGLMTALLILSTVLGGVAALGSMPFVVTYAGFIFSWRAAIAIFILSMATVIVVPWATGQLAEVWFFAILVGSIGATAGMMRWMIGRAEEFNTLQTELVMSQERSRVARDVHDVLGHSLTAIILKTQVTNAVLGEIDEPSDQVVEAREQLAEMHDLSRQALTEIRTTVTGLRTGDLNEEVTAARSILSDAGVELSINGDTSQIPEEFKPVLGWVVREAVTNVVRHAKASRCTIDLAGDDSLLCVIDDGVGPMSAREGNGLTGLRERLANNGLALLITGESGTTLSVIPVEVAA